MSQQPYGGGYAPPPPQYAPPQYAPPQYAPPQYAPPQYAPPQYAPPQYAPPQYAPPAQAPVQLSTLAEQNVSQVGTPLMPNFTDFKGRLLYVLPKKVETHAQYGDKIIADVVFFDGEPITHTMRDGAITPLKTPVRPGELLEDLWITSSRIVTGLKGTIGRTQGFAVRLDQDGKAFVLRDATPAEAQHVASEMARIRAGQAAGAQAGNPLAQHANPAVQSPAAAVAQAAGYPQPPAPPQQGQYAPQYGPGYGQPPQGMPPEQQPTQPAFNPGTWMAGPQQ